MNKYLGKEFNLVKFPILFPILYGLILYIFPKFEIYLIFFTILFLAETHFGATWPFFLNIVNKDFIKEKKLNFIIFPIMIVIFSLVGFYYFKTTFLLIFFCANMYHVTRQSFGVCNLYTSDFYEKKFQEKIIYLFNFMFFLIGFFRFYSPLIKNDHLLILNLVMIFLIFLSLIIYIYKFKLSDNFYTFLTGIVIFYPICFVNNPVHAVIMGVTMHYTQYLYLTNKVHIARKLLDPDQNNKKKYLSSIILYSILMSVLSLSGKSSNEIFSSLVIIPIVGQMLHFYLDSQLWKFSNKHNRENVLKHIVIK